MSARPGEGRTLKFRHPHSTGYYLISYDRERVLIAQAYKDLVEPREQEMGKLFLEIVEDWKREDVEQIPGEWMKPVFSYIDKTLDGGNHCAAMKLVRFPKGSRTENRLIFYRGAVIVDIDIVAEPRQMVVYYTKTSWKSIGLARSGEAD